MSSCIAHGSEISRAYLCWQDGCKLPILSHHFQLRLYSSDHCLDFSNLCGSYHYGDWVFLKETFIATDFTLPPLHTQAKCRSLCNGEGPRLSHPKVVPYHGCWDSCFLWSRALKHIVKWEWTMLRDHCTFYWWKKRDSPIPLVIYFLFIYFFTLFEFYIGDEGKKSMMDHLERRRRVLYWCLHMIVQHVLDMQALALIGAWENVLIFSLFFESMTMNDHSVWAFERNVGYNNRILLDFFIEAISMESRVTMSL